MHALSPNLNGEKNFEEYWMVVFNEKNQGQEKVNSNLTKVAATVLSLTILKCVFSQLKLIKDDHRSLLKQECLLALLSTKYSFLMKGKRQGRLVVMMDPLAQADEVQCRFLRETKTDLKVKLNKMI